MHRHQVVNLRVEQYCSVHVGAAMKKLNAKRPNLQNFGNGGVC